MFKGGYQGVDFTGYELSDTPVTIPGIFDLCTRSNKPLVVTGLTGIAPTFISGAYVESGTLIIPILTLVSDSGVEQYQIQVSDEDAVTFAAAAYPGE